MQATIKWFLRSFWDYLRKQKRNIAFSSRAYVSLDSTTYGNHILI